MRLAEPLTALTFLFIAAAPANAMQDVSFNIPAGHLGTALVALGEQGGLTVGVSDPAIAQIETRGLRGRMPVRQALSLLLRGTGYSFAFVGPHAVRIVPAATRHPAREAAVAPSAGPSSAPVQEPFPDIIVTASKQGVALDRFGGTVFMVDLGNEDVGRFGARGSEALLERLPTLASTSLGPGRNKIFIRGVADSSFNGPSQSIVGQYLGDVRLTFNAPDPDIQLYDVQRVELLEGPQGTLYGTGSLGGILRLVPNAPDASGPAASASGGMMTIAHGDPGGDAAAMVNLPLNPQLAVRAVGFGSLEGGFIDDLGQGRSNVNRVTTYGGRAALLWRPGNDWEVELGGLAQYISGRDGQYTMRGLPPLTRATRFAQPFDNDYQLGQFTIRKRWAGVDLVSATGLVRHSLETRFDATGFPGTSGTQLFVEDIDISLFSNETRLSQPDAQGEGWVVGWSLLQDTSRIRRSLGPPAALQSIAGVRNEISEAALFGQFSQPITEGLVGTIGGRLTYSRGSGMPLEVPTKKGEPDRTDVRFSPTVALTWRPGQTVLVYARFQQGFRAGGLAVSAAGSATSVQRFESDSLTSYEAGIRFGRGASDRFSFSAAISYARWADIQADLIDSNGLPHTTNLGDGRIYGLEMEAAWRPDASWSFDLGAFLNESALTAPAPAFAAADERDLPNIPGAGARAAAHFETGLSPAVRLRLDAALRYVGESQLGIGPPLDIKQGGIVEGQIGARLDFGRFGLSLDVDNMFDTRGNRFSFGNPFTVADGRQTTPLRPRTIRLGFDASF